MPQVDLEALVSACSLGSDRKIACETLAVGHGDEPTDLDNPDSAGIHTTPDFPPESFWLSKDAEFDWFDRNAFLDRKESIKRNSNSMNNFNPSVNPSLSNSNTQQFSLLLSSKATIIGLPNTQKTSYLDSKRRKCKLANILLFPKRTDSIGKSTTEDPMAEPSSPKVSCLGKVRSKRCRGCRKSNQHKEFVSQQTNAGFLSRIMLFFRSGGHRGRKTKKSAVKVEKSSGDSAPRRGEDEFPADRHDLGSMIRLSSSGRSEDGDVRPV